MVPAPGTRAVLVGQTGSGKTTLARALLATRRHVVVIDPKGMIQWPGYHVVTDRDKLFKLTADTPRIIFKPSWQELQDLDALDEVFRWIYFRRHCTCYVDELFGIADGDVYPPYFGACLTRGRELGVEMWTATQRPKRVPMVALSEAEHTYVFFLKLQQDRQRIAEMTALDETVIATLPRYHYYYAPQSAPSSGPLTLAL